MHSSNNHEARPRPMGLNIGSASIIMLFAVLCLTVLSALSLLSANSQYALAERSSNVVKAYYEADFRAAEIFERVKSGAETELEHQLAIDEHQILDVAFERVDGELRISRWRIIESDTWVPDDFFNLWNGE